MTARRAITAAAAAAALAVAGSTSAISWGDDGGSSHGRALTGALAPGAPGEGTSSARITRIAVLDNYFDPRSVSVRRGRYVRWVWRGDNSHNVRFSKVPRGVRKRGASTRRRGHWGRKLNRRGLYKYRCTIHSGMRGSIDVR